MPSSPITRRTRGSAPPPAAHPPEPEEIVPEGEWRRRERANLVAALKRAGGRIYGPGGAAELLGSSRPRCNRASGRAGSTHATCTDLARPRSRSVTAILPGAARVYALRLRRVEAEPASSQRLEERDERAAV